VVFLVAFAQPGIVLAQPAPDWRKVGSSAVELNLASPATGPVDQVWFPQGGSLLFARTHSGRVFQTADFENWSAVEPAPDPPAAVPAGAARLPEAGASVVAAPADPTRIYALGHQLFRSDDGGHSWTNLTAFKSTEVIGSGQHSVAVSPRDSNQLVVANDYGVWRSLDGGLSWTGLNQFLPNLAVRRILSTPSGVNGTRVLADNLGALELPPGGSIWTPVSTAAPDTETLLRQKYGSQLGVDLSAVGSAGSTIYAGSSDGRIWVSFDGGTTFRPTQPTASGNRVERVFVDPVEPRLALVALSGSGRHVLRTTNFGTFWDSLDNNLPDAAARSVTADRASGAVYVATDKGVYWARTDLENASIPTLTWTSLSDRLPSVPATDVKLDPASVQLYIALDGYGVYATAAPHRLRNLRIVNGGDFSTRPAAPGALLSVMGGRVSSARGGDLAYPVLAASDSESQIQVPFDAVGPSVALALTTSEGIVRRDLPVQPVSPTIMVGRDGAPMLWDADSGLPIDLRNVAHSNGRIQIWATGMGKVRPDWPAGMPAPENAPAVAAQVKAYLDGSVLQVTRATLVPGYVGFYLIEVQLPLVVNGGTSELYITADGQESNRVSIVLEP
jgi:uncharacterized protein (TIGR03437 family)